MRTEDYEYEEKQRAALTTLIFSHMRLLGFTQGGVAGELYNRSQSEIAHMMSDAPVKDIYVQIAENSLPQSVQKNLEYILEIVVPLMKRSSFLSPNAKRALTQSREHAKRLINDIDGLLGTREKPEPLMPPPQPRGPRRKTPPTAAKDLPVDSLVNSFPEKPHQPGGSSDQNNPAK